ncbi:MAG: cupin domain-containing protein [Thermoanaerobaculia bacterium]
MSPALRHASPRSARLAILCAVCLLAASHAALARPPAYDPSPEPGKLLKLGDISIRMLVEADSLGGGEVEIGELSLPGGAHGAPHEHRTLEIFFVLSGELEHVVNGQRSLLGPRSVGVVRPGDRVIHSVPAQEPVRALVIWVPGGAVSELVEKFGFRAEKADSDLDWSSGW